MRALVVMAVLSVCSAFPAIPADPQVSQPKQEGMAVRPAFSGFGFAPPQPKWMGPLASNIPASLPGSTAFVVDTPEVQNAKNHFYNTYKSQVIATRPSPDSPSYYYYEPSPSAPVYVPDTPQKKWTGPLASQVPAGLPGSSPVVFDTPEVHNAKAHFFNTYKQQVKAIIPRRFSF